MIRILQCKEYVGGGERRGEGRGGRGEGRWDEGKGGGRGTGEGIVRTPWFAYALTRTIEGAGACKYVCVGGFVWLCGCVW